MKSILLHIYEDEALESRLQAALDAARAFGGHITCLQATPFTAYVAFDPMGGAFAQTAVMDELRTRESELKSRLEARLAHEDVAWDWAQVDGDVVASLAQWSALNDMVVVSQFNRKGEDDALPIVDALAIESACPVLVVPGDAKGLNLSAPVVLGWNASAEAAGTIRQALPVLQAASAVHIVSVGEDGMDFPQMAASAYLSRHGVKSELHTIAAGRAKPAEALVNFARESGAGMIVMGAYGHSRLRETLLGGVTRDLLASSRIPLLLGH